MNDQAQTAAVTLTIDGKEITVPAGTLIIRAAEQLGIEIPRFCDHPMLEPIGACRQCYVEIEGQRKLFTSCTTPVANGMVVRSQNSSEEAKTAQVANLEFLLLNHPLDCPVCDRGGECPLQDQTLSHGPGESRFVEAKRTYEKPIALSPLIGLDRERCVLCARCTRFCDEISGDRQIELFNRGAGEQVAIAPGEQFDSHFSGNTVQICPVGALTATPYRFAARPFDLQTVDTVCPHCSAGCNIRLDVRRGEVVRVLARDNEEVNDAWICDKGRFAFRYLDSPDRLTTPLVRRGGLEPASYEEAFGEIKKASEGKRVAFLTGGRLCDEDYYVLSKLARTVFKTNDLDHRRASAGPGVEHFSAAGAGQVTYRDIEGANVIVIVGSDLEQEVPILHLRVRKAAKRGARVFVVHPRRTRLWDIAEHILCAPGGEAVALAKSEEIRKAVTEARSGTTVVVAGERLTGGDSAADPAFNFASEMNAKFVFVSRRANDKGAMRAGVHPHLLPGGRQVHDPDAAAEVETVWGRIDAFTGRGTAELLKAAADRSIDVLFLIGVDPLRDFPDAALTQRAIENVEFLVVQDIARGDYDIYADVMLPAAALGERDGHYTTWEGRGQKVRAIRGAPGVARPDWEIFAGLAEVMGRGLGFDSVDDLHEEMGTLLAPRKSANLIVATDANAEPTGGSTLLSYPLLVDEGRMSWDADELKLAQEQPAFAEINSEDAAETGIEDGANVRLKTEAGEAELPARVTDHIARGAVFVPWNQPGFAANALLSGDFITPVTLEPVAGESQSELAGEPAEAGV